MVKFGENNEVIREEDSRAILVGLQLNEDISYSMQELWGLAEAAGVTVLGELIQNKERPDNATLIGKGKVEELALLCENMQADNVVSNGEEQIQKNNAQMGMPHNSVYNPARANQQESNAQFNPGYYNSESGNLSQLENTASQFPQSQIDRIDLADIRRLFPTKQYYANNSFVIHGFMNYSHLIVKTEDNKKYLGVPGIYEKPEEMMAKLFGFTEFVDEKTHSESQTEGAFGYWLSQAL